MKKLILALSIIFSLLLAPSALASKPKIDFARAFPSKTNIAVATKVSSNTNAVRVVYCLQKYDTKKKRCIGKKIVKKPFKQCKRGSKYCSILVAYFSKKTVQIKGYVVASNSDGSVRKSWS